MAHKYILQILYTNVYAMYNICNIYLSTAVFIAKARQN